MGTTAFAFDRVNIERPVLSVDVALFSLAAGDLTVMLAPREHDPFLGAEALPGVALRVDETLENAARRALAVKAGVGAGDAGAIHIEQLAAFDGLKRDPRRRSVSVAFMGVTPSFLGTSAACWRKAASIGAGDLPFDHAEIVQTAMRRLRGKLRYTNIAGKFLPATFRIDELLAVYESVLFQRLNLTNFRNKLLAVGLIERVDVLKWAVGKSGGRPPHLYRFTSGCVVPQCRDFI